MFTSFVGSFLVPGLLWWWYFLEINSSKGGLPIPTFLRGTVTVTLLAGTFSSVIQESFPEGHHKTSLKEPISYVGTPHLMTKLLSELVNSEKLEGKCLVMCCGATGDVFFNKCHMTPHL